MVLGIDQPLLREVLQYVLTNAVSWSNVDYVGGATLGAWRRRPVISGAGSAVTCGARWFHSFSIRPFSDWGNILFNTTLAIAIADRLVENSEIFLLAGESLRKPKKEPVPDWLYSGAGL